MYQLANYAFKNDLDYTVQVNNYLTHVINLLCIILKFQNRITAEVSRLKKHYSIIQMRKKNLNVECEVLSAVVKLLPLFGSNCRVGSKRLYLCRNGRPAKMLLLWQHCPTPMLPVKFEPIILFKYLIGPLCIFMYVHLVSRKYLNVTIIVVR